MKNFEILKKKASLVRKWCQFSTTEAGFGHSISCLSAADITTILLNDYFSYDLSALLTKYHDQLIFSKVHPATLKTKNVSSYVYRNNHSKDHYALRTAISK
jgi:transketolase